MPLLTHSLLFVMSLAVVVVHALPGAAAELRLATFQADVTPPLGDGVGIGFMRETLRIEHPLLAKGIILESSTGNDVVCAVDFCGLSNQTYDLFRQKIATAAGTSPSRVALQVLHQHTAPTLDMDARKLLYHDDPAALARGLDFTEKTADTIGTAIRNARENVSAVTHVGTSAAIVKRVASSRRLVQSDGSLLSRLSSTTNPQLIAALEGLIDPWLRTVAFYRNDQKLVELHYYATHPQSIYGAGRVTYDVPGIARERLQEETGVFQVYLTGCGGNVAFGKYNKGTPDARQQLVQRLYESMQGASKSLERQPATNVSFQKVKLRFPLTTGAAYSEQTNRNILDDPAASRSQKIKAAMNLAWIERIQGGHLIEASCLSIGSVRLIQLPGEVFVEYQLFAQQLDPELFIAVAAYGDCGMWYIGPDQIYKDRGGYEQTWSFGGPVEQQLKQALTTLLAE